MLIQFPCFRRHGKIIFFISTGSSKLLVFSPFIVCKKQFFAMLNWSYKFKKKLPFKAIVYLLVESGFLICIIWSYCQLMK